MESHRKRGRDGERREGWRNMHLEVDGDGERWREMRWGREREICSERYMEMDRDGKRGRDGER